ncbi:2-C-methyl-D-erythritol 4-phosphate cytidylyltransferase [bacterium LRH843]|nr:2-C-methyl-D-erythritol 4-phosphate cytidylyltransferase [bacterium LRH843]
MKAYSVIIPAAGQGKRMKAGMNKQFLKLRDEPIIVHTVRFFENDQACKQVIIVANEDECMMMQDVMNKYGLKKVAAVIKGGKERQQSVRNGINYLDEEQIVLIHDGARPFVSKGMIDRIVTKAEETGAVTAAVRVTDTIKRVSSGKIIDTLKRDELWSIQTPQAFSLSLLKEAHEKAEKAGLIGTDDASLVEWLGHDVSIADGDYTNIKLTTPGDLLFAEAIMQERERNKHD